MEEFDIKFRRNNRRYRLVFFCFLFVFAFCLSLWGMARFHLSVAQNNKQVTKQPMPQRENFNLDHLTSLLSSDGISINEMILLPARVTQSRTVRARWKSADASSLEKSFTSEPAQESLLSLLEIKPHRGGLARQRSLELSPTQVLVVMVNQNNQVLWWDLMPDPRLLRAETADAEGIISGKTLYSTNAEMLVSYPADMAITELRFYHPNWDGQSYSLQTIGNLFLNSAVK